MAAEQKMNPHIQEIRKERLEICKRIGRGSFGVVHLAFDHDRHHYCAVKTMSSLPPEFTAR